VYNENIVWNVVIIFSSAVELLLLLFFCFNCLFCFSRASIMLMYCVYMFAVCTTRALYLRNFWYFYFCCARFQLGGYCWAARQTTKAAKRAYSIGNNNNNYRQNGTAVSFIMLLCSHKHDKLSRNGNTLSQHFVV
jgi:hypothetical protein